MKRMKEYKRERKKRNVKNGTAVSWGSQNKGLEILNILKMVLVFFRRRNQPWYKGCHRQMLKLALKTEFDTIKLRC